MRTKKLAHPVSRWRFVVAAMLLAGGLGGSPTLLAQDFTEPEEEITENKVTTWVGNTFGGVWDGERSKRTHRFGKSRRGHVPMGIDAIAVADDGTVYTKTQQQDESHKQYGIFAKNGDDLGQFGWDPGSTSQQPFLTKGRGNAIAVSEDYVILEASTAPQGNFGRVRKYSRATGLPVGPNVTIGENVEGLLIHEDELYASDPVDNKIKVYRIDSLDLEPVREFDFADPGRLTVDGEGYLWIARTSDNRIYRYSIAGESQKEKIVLPEGSVVSDVRYNDSEGNAYSGLLMVADNGPDLNIKFYDLKETTKSAEPILTFGEQGGIYSGVPGEYKPTKFRNNLTGVDNDADGNLYISITGQQTTNHGVSLFSFGSSGELRWQRHNLAFMDVGVIDPRSENNVYTEYYRYNVEYNQGFADNRAKGWAIRGYTMDARRYPDDIRSILDLGSDGEDRAKIGQLMAPFKVMYQNDQKIIYYMHALGEYVAAFRASPSTDGEILIPCLVISKFNRSHTVWPEERPASGSWMWIDDNGDGQMQAEEFSSSGEELKGWAWDVDDNADIWLASYQEKIKQFAFQGTTAQGIPRYDFEQVTEYDRPMLFEGHDMKRITYNAANDVMYIGGYTDKYPNEEKIWSGGLGRVVARFDNWTTNDDHQPTWTIENLTYDPNPNRNVKHYDVLVTSMDIAGEYLFLARNSADRGEGESGKIRDARNIEVYRKSDGKPVGNLLPGPNASYGVGQLDMVFGMRAFQRQNGQYIVFEEDDWFGNVLVHQWSPGDQPPPQPEGQRPYQGIAHTLPGTIEGEHYDEGGAEVAYHDDGDKEGDDQYRQDDKVDVTEKAEASNGRSVGFTEEGEWLEYTVNASGGTYEVTLTTATGADERGDLQMSLDGEVIGTFSGADLANEGWLSFQTLTLSGVEIPEGEGQVLRLEYVNGGGFDLDAIAFVEVGSSDTTGLAPVADASVRDGAYRNENYGSEGYLWVKDAPADFTRRSLLRFDISDLPQGASTELVLTVTSLGGENVAERSVAVHALSDDSWQEGEVTWDNQPAVGELLATVTVGESDEGQSVRVDVTEYVAEQSGTVGFALVQPGGQNAIVSFASRESDNPPLLRGQTEASAQENASLAPATARLEGSPDVLLYPNPVEEVLRVRRSVVTREEVPKTSGTYAAGSRTTEGAVLRILSLTGQPLIRQALDASGEVNVSTLPPGMYIVRISQPGMPEWQTKIVKQ